MYFSKKTVYIWKKDSEKVSKFDTYEMSNLYIYP